jgi:hypothetical protein
MVVDPSSDEARRSPRTAAPANTPKSRLNPQVIANVRDEPGAARPTFVHLIAAHDEESLPLDERLRGPGFRREPITFIQ